MVLAQQLIFLAALLILGAIAVMDLRERRIPNVLVLIVVVIALAHMALSRDVASIANDVGLAGLVLAGSLALWASKWFGGGDVKLMFAASLLVGSRALPDFLVLTALLGGALGMLTIGDMWLNKYYGWSTGLSHPLSNLKILTPRAPTVPYGIAICLACVTSLLATSPALVT